LRIGDRSIQWEEISNRFNGKREAGMEIEPIPHSRSGAKQSVPTQK